MSLRAGLSVAAVAVLSLAACAVTPTRAGNPSPRLAPAVAASPAHPDDAAGPAALADELPVATDCGACTQRMDLHEQDEKAAADEGMRRFDALMRGGGALYELGPTEAGELECERWSVHPPSSRGRQGGLERIRRDDRTITTTSFGYEWSTAGNELGRGPWITLFGPYSIIEGPEGRRGKGRPCASMDEVSGVNCDVVLMGGNRMYLTQDACEGVHQTILARLRWLPPDGGTPAERMAALAGGGMPGC
jgi:hypothetical protein